MNVNILLPFPPRHPAGGTRVMYEIANHLADLNHSVTIYHPIKIKYSVYYKPYWLRLLYFSLFKPPKWFKLHSSVKTKTIPTIKENYIKDGDILLFTWWAIAYHVYNLPIKKGKKYNLIQDIEFWAGFKEQVIQSYQLADIQNIVIAKHLQAFVSQYSRTPVFKIPLAIDNSKYKITVLPEDRDNLTVCMMYSDEPRKGSKYGIEALKIVKAKLPGLKVIFFSAFKQPPDIPEFIAYTRKPDSLEDIYNNSAIFLGPSLQEGCALPPMEAMMCGCAVICTAIDGHNEYSRPGETTLTAQPEDANALAGQIIKLATNPALRIEIAKNGNAFIKKYTWAEATNVLLNILEPKL